MFSLPRSSASLLLQSHRLHASSCLPRNGLRWSFASSVSGADESVTSEKIRLVRLVSSYGTNIQMSRRSAERMILDGNVSVAGQIINDPLTMLSLEDATGTVKVGGRRLMLPKMTKKKNITTGRGQARGDTDSKENNSGQQGATRNTINANPVNTRIWLAHKLPGEIVAENDPHGRPSILDRLRRGGVGKPKKKSQHRIHLKPIGRLDMMTEGLLLLTNDGAYAREMELPANSFHRTYRARIHGQITPSKMKAIRRGVNITENGSVVKYGGMDVRIEKAPARRERATNTWVRVTCSEGKNRQIRKIFQNLGLKVTRLIRTAYGDYDLNTIPPGMALEVPVKPLDKQKKRGRLVSRINDKAKNNRRAYSDAEGEVDGRATVQWVRHV